MSQYTIVRRCGHTETIQIYGKVADRQGKADWEATRLCAECYKAEQAAQRAAENAAAAESAQAAGLPALAGSEKQIAWAESIRKVAADGVADFRTRIIGAMERAKAEGRTLPATAEAAKVAAEAIFAELLANAEAKYWIDNRQALGEKYAFGQWMDRAIRARLAA